MTQRHLRLGAIALAMLVQASFVAAYHYSTVGCFCAITTSQPAPPAFVVWIFLAASAPLQQLLQGTDIQVGGWLPTLVFAALNGVFWAIGFFGLLNLIALMCRVRLATTSGGKRRIRLVSLAALRRRRMAAGMLLLVIAGLAAGAQYRRWWISSAKAALHVAVQSVRDGKPFHKNGKYDISCYDACEAGRFAGAFSLKRFAGAHPLDAFVAPTELAARIDFASGSRYHARIYHGDGIWKVMIAPAE